MEEANTIHDVIVIGGGLMGSSAAWHVSNQKSVLLIEKQGPNYDSGSSKGQARICRCSNIENDELWSYLHNCSVREVEKLIDFLNQNGEDRTMKDVYTTSPVSYIARLEDLNQLLANLAKQNVIFDIACTSEEGNSKFGVNLKKNTFLQRENNRNSGTINPQRLIQFLHKAITLKGNRILYKTKVEHIQIKDDLYAIAVLNKNGKTKVMYAKQVICAGGPFTGQLLQTMAPYFKDLISPKRVYLTFLKIKDAPYQNLTSTQKKQLQNGFPIIDRSSNELTDEFYAMIERYDLYNNPIIKIGGHFQRSAISNLDEIWNTKLSEDELNWGLLKVATYLHVLNLPIKAQHLEVVDEYSCVYSLTESEVPFVTPIIDLDGSKNPNFVAMTGMSGVGAKGAMAYGQIAAHLLSGKLKENSFYKKTIAKLGYERLVAELSGN